jgi:hypothetical protein
MTLLTRAINRFGWTLMGYPAAIAWNRLVIDPVPGWGTVYRWGARLSNWERP